MKMKDAVEELVKSATEARDACQALQFAQAALNIANAIRVLQDAEKQ